VLGHTEETLKIKRDRKKSENDRVGDETISIAINKHTRHFI
jgi:hypothetical protein